MKDIIGWSVHKSARRPGPCALLDIVAVACSAYAFHSPQLLQSLVMELLTIFFLLAGRGGGAFFSLLGIQHSAVFICCIAIQGRPLASES